MTKVKLSGVASCSAPGLAIDGRRPLGPRTDGRRPGRADRRSGPSLNNNSLNSQNNSNPGISLLSGAAEVEDSQNENSSQANSQRQRVAVRQHGGHRRPRAGKTPKTNNSSQDNEYSNNSGRDNSLHPNVRLNLTSRDLSSRISGAYYNGSDTAATNNRSINSGALSYSAG